MQILYKSDTFGAVAGTLCMVHCIATPFLFIAQTCTVSSIEAIPVWWQWIDYFFLFISCIAVYQSSRTTSRNWMKRVLWLCWLMLSVVILNEKMEWFFLPEGVIYVPALALIVCHLYNRKFCQCRENHCCLDMKGKEVDQ